MTEDDGTPSTHNLKLLKDFPSDLCSVHHALCIEPDTTKYAACSKCNMMYSPKTIGRHLEWPMECTSHCFEDSSICGQVLVKLAVKRGEGI